jgi:hypothetical protein
MNEPDPQLMQLYGTDELYKEAQQSGMPTAVRIAAALLGFGLLMGDRSSARSTREEAQRLNEIMRMMEEERMRPTIEALHGQLVPANQKTASAGARELAMSTGRYMAKVAALNSGLEKLAQGLETSPLEKETVTYHLLEKLASGGPDALSEMEKQALPALLAGMAGAARTGVRAAGRMFGRGKSPWAGGPTARAAGAPITSSAPGAHGFSMSRVGKLSEPPKLVPGTTKAAPAPGPSTATALTRPTSTPLAAPERALAAQGTAARQTTQQAALAKRPPPIPPEAVRGAQPAAAGGGMGMKGKLIAGGVLAAGGLGAWQAAKAGRDYMMVPSQQARWGSGMRAPSGVSPYGY